MCRLCSSKEETRNINLFVFGSEGLDVCHECEMKLVEFSRKLANENTDKIIESALRCKKFIEASYDNYF